MKARCSGWSFSIVPSPSRVVMAPLAAADTGTEQERADLPSSSTVQAPHWASPQPNLGPFSSRSLRRTYRSGVSGASEDSFRVAPFTRNVKSAMFVLRSGSSAWAGTKRTPASRCVPILLELDAGLLDHLFPAREVFADLRSELLRSITHRLDAEHAVALLHGRLGENRGDFALEPPDHRLRGPSRRKHAD